MPKAASRGKDRDDDLEVLMTEVDADEVDNDDEDEDGTGGGLTDIDDEDDNHGPSEEDEDESNEDDEDERPVARDSRPQQRNSGNNPRDAFLKRLKRAERQIAEVRDENAELANSNQRMAGELQKIKVGGDVDKVKKESEIKLKDLGDKLEVAIEAGDSKAQRTLIEQISDVKAELKKTEALAEAAKGAGDTQPVERYQRLAAQWKRKHQRFNTDEAFAGYVAAIDRALAREGMNRNSDKYFVELDKRVKERFPEEYGRTAPPRRTHPSSGPDADGGSNANASRTTKQTGNFARKGKAHILSRRQESIMRKVGLDPTDAEDRKTFVRENL